ncbi:MAG: hypothetical protein L6Q71_09020 [Planctomycetes bacterium]|nr:hypothetical protein [Planctomycetota bacterium]NUQ35544.1 hypothetical protein [Planctomycetaceae bacterium]
MSRRYGIVAEISGYDKSREAAIKRTLKDYWPFRTWDDMDTMLIAEYARCTLGEGQDEEEFVNDVAKAVWAANGGYCKVRLHMTCLDSYPTAVHTREREHFERLKAG